MFNYRQSGINSNEAGGILLGRFIVNSNDVIIDEVTIPCKQDVRRFLSFFRSQKPHYKIYLKKWRESKGTCNYLGDWHTHPEENPSHSFQDSKNWRNILNKSKCSYEDLFFIIIGINNIKVWHGNRKDLSIKLLEKIN